MYGTHYSFSSPKPYHSIEMPKTFQEDIECIIKGRADGFGSLYISNVEAASNPTTLKRFKIQAILSCAKGYQLKHPKSLVPHYKYIPTVDHDECDISKHFEEAIEFLHTTLKQTNVLAHCIAGVSRSVSMVLAYFIKHHGMDYEEAYRLVKSKRNKIHPNDGFIRQLKDFGKRVKNQKRNQSRERSVSSRQSDKSIKLEENNDYNELKIGRADNKSQELKPYEAKIQESSSLNKQRSPYASFYERYNSLEMKNAPPKYVPPRKDNYFQSLQNIPEPANPKDNALTPKADKKQEPFELARTTTNFFTPNKHLINQRAYEPPRRYDEYPKSAKADRPGTSPIINAENKQIGREQRGNGADQRIEPKRVEYFTNMSNELNDKIEAIRQKYAAERQKLFNKYQSPQRARVYETRLQEQRLVDRRRVSLQQPKAQPQHYKAFLDQHRNPHYDNFNTSAKKSPLPSKPNYRGYEELYSKKYDRVPGINNEEESYLTKYDGIRGSLNATEKKTSYDRLGYYQPKKYAFQTTYSPYYNRYGSYGRY